MASSTPIGSARRTFSVPPSNVLCLATTSSGWTETGNRAWASRFTFLHLLPSVLVTLSIHDTTLQNQQVMTPTRSRTSRRTLRCDVHLLYVGRVREINVSNPWVFWVQINSLLSLRPCYLKPQAHVRIIFYPNVLVHTWTAITSPRPATYQACAIKYNFLTVQYNREK